jgi:hypothetical protein
VVWPDLFHGNGDFDFDCVCVDAPEIREPRGALLHASHHLYIQAMFTPLTRNTGKTAWFIDEFGAILPLVTVVFGIYFWNMRNQLARPGPGIES